MKSKSTFDRIMQDPQRRKSFEKKYNEFYLSEMISELMEQEHISVRELAEKTNLSPTVIQDIKSGKRDNPTFNSLISVIEALGAEIVFKKGKKELYHVPKVHV
ncbi:helix-turn-helix domain-containing protein [Leptospira sp. FAT2]|uniref:helix-turn-helix domain-containing protein n=1 Tax=Leptospira sanjuanensis TaxID=2879643 RepID=UPI001EE8266C|nr:helix-turn-helix transcriptional regulator [Leptospira sanjuanensis]MCG6195669.1 helix-turn-helix domain-containing protein [Leptospira sanjuanensis]